MGFPLGRWSQEHWLKLCTASLLSPVLSARLQAEAPRGFHECVKCGTGVSGNGVMLVKKIYHKPHETTHIVMAYTSHGQIGYGLLLLYQHYTGFWGRLFSDKATCRNGFYVFFFQMQSFGWLTACVLSSRIFNQSWPTCSIEIFLRLYATVPCTIYTNIHQYKNTRTM